MVSCGAVAVQETYSVAVPAGRVLCPKSAYSQALRTRVRIRGNGSGGYDTLSSDSRL